MQQLSLFAELPEEKSAPRYLDAEENTPPSPALPQLDLFGDRWLAASAAHEALERFELNRASAETRLLLKRYPDDASLTERATALESLATELTRGRTHSASEAAALAAIERSVPPFLDSFWRRHLAATLETEGGLGAVLDGQPAGFHWLLCGELVRAETSLLATLDRDPSDARARAYLADVLTRQGKPSLARMHYRDALAHGPDQIDMARVLDPIVKRLPSVAEDDYEVPGEGIEWAAAIGVLTGTFEPPDWTSLRATASATPSAAGVEFYHWLGREMLAESMADRVACRRAMRALAGGVFARYLARLR